MAGAREPTALVIAKGKKHLSQSEIEARQASEVKPPKPKRVSPPKWLPSSCQKDFRAIAKQLLELGIFCKLDADVLGRYLIAHQLYLQATKEVIARMRDEFVDIEAVSDWTSVQDKYFKQCETCARALGLSVSSRCKLVVPIVQPTAAAPNPMFGD